MRSLKDGKIVVLLQGRYAGKKAVILKTMDDNTKERPYGHCVVVGARAALSSPCSSLYPARSESVPCQSLQSFIDADCYVQELPSAHSPSPALCASQPPR